jgi:hypothetical protein
MGILSDIYRAFIKRESVNVGDIFMYMGLDNKNPFNREAKYHVTVLEVKDGYVKYSFGSSGTTIDSNSICMFRSMYKKKT